MTAAAEETPWLRLARFSEDHAENKRLWNGYQKYLLRPHSYECQRQMDNPKFVDIVDLSDAEFHSIQMKVAYLPKVLGEAQTIAVAKFDAEIKTRLELDGFYFAFPVFIQNTTFKSLLTLKHAQFAAGLDAIKCDFEGGLIAMNANFGSTTIFSNCHFIGGTSFRDAKFEGR